MKYVITKKQCQSEIDKMNRVCDYCGRKLKPQKTVDNAGNPTYWVGCMHGKDNDKNAWGAFTHGVSKDIYDLACKIVKEDMTYIGMEFVGYNFEYNFRQGVSVVTGILKTIERLKDKKVKPRFTKAELTKRFRKE